LSPPKKILYISGETSKDKDLNLFNSIIKKLKYIINKFIIIHKIIKIIYIYIKNIDKKILQINKKYDRI